jgi:hypothetical protein
MSEKAGGSGAANDATVVVDENPAAVEQEDPLPFLKLVVESAKTKVEKQEAHLALAKTALKTAQAELAAAKGN